MGGRRPSPPPLLTLFQDIVIEWRTAQTPLRQLLDVHSRALRSLSSRNRRRLEALVFGYARYRDRIDHVVEVATRALPIEARRPTRRERFAMACHALEQLLPADLGEPGDGGGMARAHLPPALLQAIDTAAVQPLGDGDSAGDLALAYAFPRDVVDDLTAQLGRQQTQDALTALNQRAPLILRPRLPASAEDLIQALANDGVESTPHPAVPGAVVVHGRVNLDRHPFLRSGRAVVQDAASQLASLVLDAAAGHTVFDVCAGGGGKALAVADQLSNSGRLVLLDRDARRLARAARRVGRSPTIEVVQHDARQPFPAALLGAADRVLADLPCSGLGTVRRHPELKWRYDTDAVCGFADDQLRIAENACACLKPGGRILYATCSLRRIENDEVVDHLVDRAPLKPVALNRVLGDLAAELGAVGERLTLWPHRHHCDGFFLALYEKQ